MSELCEIEVSISSAGERAYKVIGSNYKYTNNYQASLYNDLFIIPRSQVKEIRDIGNSRQIMVLPKWLVIKNGLEKFIVNS